MSEFNAIHPVGWKDASGFSHGLSMPSGRVVFTAGQIGWNPVTCEFETDDFTAQTTQALRNIVAILKASAATPAHLVRLTWYITDREAYLNARKEIGAAYREIIGRHFPPMSVVVVQALIESRAKVEIEATAVVPV
jgi:enamine deaminase RidA (YjgF/YER057c/UK114 family)